MIGSLVATVCVLKTRPDRIVGPVELGTDQVIDLIQLLDRLCH